MKDYESYLFQALTGSSQQYRRVRVSTYVCVWNMFLCLYVQRNALKRHIAPELHLNQAELLEVCAQLEGSENGVFLGQHDQRGAG